MHTYLKSEQYVKIVYFFGLCRKFYCFNFAFTLIIRFPQFPFFFFTKAAFLLSADLLESRFVRFPPQRPHTDSELHQHTTKESVYLFSLNSVYFDIFYLSFLHAAIYVAGDFMLVLVIKKNHVSHEWFLKIPGKRRLCYFDLFLLNLIQMLRSTIPVSPVPCSIIHSLF